MKDSDLLFDDGIGSRSFDLDNLPHNKEITKTVEINDVSLFNFYTYHLMKIYFHCCPNYCLVWPNSWNVCIFNVAWCNYFNIYTILESFFKF